MERKRGANGKFTLKGEEVRKTRTVRLTDSTWGQLQKMSEEQNKTKSDLLEDTLSNSSNPCITIVYDALKILKEELKPSGFSASRSHKEFTISAKAADEVIQILRDFVSEATT